MRVILLLFFLVLGTAHAQSLGDAKNTVTEESPFQSLDIRMFRPEFSMKKQQDRQGIVISGQVEQEIEIVYVNDSLKRLNEATSAYEGMPLPAANAIGLPAKTNRNGIFSFEVFLPRGKYKIDFQFSDPKDQRRTKIMTVDFSQGGNQLDIVFDESSVFEPNRPAGTGQNSKTQVVKLKAIKNYYSFGLGANYLLYTKTNADIPLDARFGSFEIPSGRFEYHKEINSNWGLDASLLLAPGKTKSGERIDIDNGQYLWTILGGEAKYTRPEWVYKYGTVGELHYGILAGAQFHMLPYLKSATSENTSQTMDSNTMGALSTGMYANFLTSEAWEFQSLARFHYFGFVGNKFTMKEQFSFDGSFGAVHKPKGSKWAYGGFWYGQYMTGVINEKDAFIQGSINSKIGLLYSNFEFRMFYQF